MQTKLTMKGIKNQKKIYRQHLRVDILIGGGDGDDEAPGDRAIPHEENPADKHSLKHIIHYSVFNKYLMLEPCEQRKILNCCVQQENRKLA